MKTDNIDPEMYSKKTNVISITKKLKAETLKIKYEQDKLKAESSKVSSEELKVLKEIEGLNQQLLLNRLDAKAKAKSEKTTGILCKMMIVSSVMSTTYSQDSNLGNNRVFDDDDLIEYKAKMLELLKQL